jgi:hypothetical protein
MRKIDIQERRVTHLRSYMTSPLADLLSCFKKTISFHAIQDGQTSTNVQKNYKGLCFFQFAIERQEVLSYCLDFYL